jgi:hypothetical protein
MRFPWNGGSISLRWRMCASPLVSRIELGPANGSSTVELAPPRSSSSGAANTRLIVSGSDTSTIGASAHSVRSVNGSPYRAALRRSRSVGRATHSTVCAAAGALGPGGSMRTT